MSAFAQVERLMRPIHPNRKRLGGLGVQIPWTCTHLLDMRVILGPGRVPACLGWIRV
jgi:hypothetical protein